MSSLVIAAIPAEDDVVWKISSEKKPHLTLMYLGEVSENNNSARMAEFVEHALNINEHGPFYLDVDYRGELGDDKADVLFFCNGWDSKWIKSLRGQLLKHNDIRAAYEANDQFPEWVPHLTLGYPTAPAKPFPKEYSGKIYSVQFDRIAVWTGDYEGPEFRLKWPEREMSDDEAIAYSDIGEATVEELLHYGVKGMQWGKRKEQVSGAAKSAARTVAKGAKDAAASSAAKAVGKKASAARDTVGDARFKARSSSNPVIVHTMNEAVNRTRNEDLPKINEKYKGKAKTSTRLKVGGNPFNNDATQKAYHKEVSDAYVKRLSEVADSQTSGSGRFKYALRPGAFAKNPTALRWRITAVKVEHAVSATDEFDLVPKFDADGFIIDFDIQPVEDSVAHSMSEGEAFVLEHASVLDDSNVRDKIKAKVQSILDDVTGDDDKDARLFGDPLVRAKLQSVLEDFYKVGIDKAAAYSAVAEVYLEHIGVKGMRWGHRKAPEAVAPKATSKVPHGKRRKTKVDVEGGENHPAHEDAIKLAEAQAKLKRSGAAALSNNELREVATRLQLENQVSLLSGHKGKQFVAKNLRSESENLARTGFRVGVKKGVKRVGIAALA